MLKEIFSYKPSFADGADSIQDYNKIYAAMRETSYEQENALAILGDRAEAGLTRLISSFCAPGMNSVISPSTLLYALILLGQITGGETRKEIYESIGIKEGDATAVADAIWKGIASTLHSPACQMGNSIWINDNVDVDPEKLEKLCESCRSSAFRGEMGSDEINEAIGKWLNLQTKNLLEKDVAGVNTTEDTVLELLSTVYFKSGWADEFEDYRTKEGRFHVSPTQNVTCEFMSSTTDTTLYKGMQYTAVRKELEGEYEVVFILPNKGKTVADLLESCELYKLVFRDKSLMNEYCRVTMKIPKFDVSNKIDLLSGLEEMGIRRVLDPSRADFSGIMNDAQLVLSKAEQASRVRIDEKGVEGASYVEMGIVATGLPPQLKKISFTLDRPFIFAVMRGQVPIFFGTVNDPSA